MNLLTTRTRGPKHVRAGALRQRGAYAIEFALVFLLFFGFLYTIICYGIIFTLRFGLQNAAEDGARAALRYQIDLPARERKAAEIALLQTNGWLPVTPQIVAQICTIDSGNCAAATRTCSSQWDQRCQIVVTVTANGMGAILPPLPSFAMPEKLVGRASMQLDGRAL